MFYIIEKQNQLDKLHIEDELFVHIIPTNPNYHPALQDISLIYIRGINSHKGYILCINHSESFSIDKRDIINRLSPLNKIYVLDKKSFLHHVSPFISSDIIYDISLYNSLFSIQNEININQFETKVEVDFNSKYFDKEPSIIIPISKHYEKWENTYDYLEPLISKITPYNSYNLINNIALYMFYNIEKEGIHLDKKSFIKHFGDIRNPQFNIKKGKIFTQYNFNTITGRPSNRFNNINFAALNKKNNERESFIPRNDKFIEIDFNAYHPNIISRMVGYEYNTSLDFYNELAKNFPNSNPGNIKELVFQQLYGVINEKYANKPFFKETYKFSMEKWEHFIKGEPIQNNELGKIFTNEIIENPTPAKLLNYLVQNNETIYNIIQFNKIFKMLEEADSKIILYTFDSLLIDVCNDEEETIREGIREILKFNYSTKVGENYNEMEKI